MKAFLGLDTSNYTTSAALYFPQEDRIVQSKRLLPVKAGERGLRQSDAVFHHTVALPEMVHTLFRERAVELCGVCASVTPRRAEGSYMPCFLVGAGAGRMLAETHGVPFYDTSHQHGHIAAALFGSGKLELLEQRFLAFHVSGGTTEALLVQPEESDLFRCTLVASSLDLKAGQAIDRTGVLLGLRFPCGKALDALSLESARTFSVRPSMKGADCSLSGVENQCKAMIERGEPACDVAKFCLVSVCAALEAMTAALLEQYGGLPVLFAGGVMSNTLMRKRLQERFGAFFAEPEYSADNAAGTALIGYYQHQQEKK